MNKEEIELSKKFLKGSNIKQFFIGDKVRVIGNQYYNNSYDIITDITPDKYVIDDGCTYKKNELQLIERKKENE